MTRLFRLEQPSRLLQCLVRAQAQRLVEQQNAVQRAAEIATHVLLRSVVVALARVGLVGGDRIADQAAQAIGLPDLGVGTKMELGDVAHA